MNRIAALVALACVASLAHADEVSHRKPGLWVIVTQPTAPQRQPMTHRLCLDRDTEALMNRMSAGTLQQACAKNEMHAAAGHITLHAVCSFGSSQLTSDAVITFNGDSSYSSDTHARFEPPLKGTGETHTCRRASGSAPVRPIWRRAT